MVCCLVNLGGFLLWGAAKTFRDRLLASVVRKVCIDMFLSWLLFLPFSFSVVVILIVLLFFSFPNL